MQNFKKILYILQKCKTVRENCKLSEWKHPHGFCYHKYTDGKQRFTDEIHWREEIENEAEKRQTEVQGAQLDLSCAPGDGHSAGRSVDVCDIRTLVRGRQSPAQI